MRFVLALALLLFSVHAEAQPAPETKLHPQGVLTIKETSEIKYKNCRSKRLWPEITGLASKEAQEKLNAKFRRIMTVGKKLTDDDCPGEDYPEDDEYYNEARIGGQRGKYLGIGFLTVFPGGSLRMNFDCRIFNLEDGSELHLWKLIKKSAADYVETSLKKRCLENSENIDTDCDVSLPNSPLSTQPHAFPICLYPEGLVLNTDPFSKQGWTMIPLKKEDKDHIFISSPQIDSLFQN